MKVRRSSLTLDEQWAIYDKPARQVDIRYLSAGRGLTPSERDVRIDWEGRDIGFFSPKESIDTVREIVRVWVWDAGWDEILLEVPGEDYNATGTRIWASREWLERMQVDEIGSE